MRELDREKGFEGTPGNFSRQRYDRARQRKAENRKELFSWVESLVTAVAVTVIGFGFLARTATVSGDSMLPTMHEGDVVLLSGLFYDPKPGDVVIVTQPLTMEEPLIKRVIAVGGQTVDIDFNAGEVRVDGVLLDEPYILETTHHGFDLEFPQTVPEDHVFVMGDNRNNSLDSRSSVIGMIDCRNILGKVYLRFLPPQDFGLVR